MKNFLIKSIFALSFFLLLKLNEKTREIKALVIKGSILLKIIESLRNESSSYSRFYRYWK
jgi:hypothetical protein